MIAELPEDPPEDPPEDLLEDLPETAESEFEATMVIAPDASLSNKPSGNSTEAFIERVKGQLPENPGERKVEPFNSTVPQ